MNAEGGTRNAEQPSRIVAPRDLKERTKAFAVGIVRLVQELPHGRVRSRREFLAKMGIVEEEADETSLWLDLLVEARLVTSARVLDLRHEAGQLVAITVASIRTARGGGGSGPRSAFRVPRSS